MVYKGMVFKGQNISSTEDFRKKLGYSVDPSTERFWHKGQYGNTQHFRHIVSAFKFRLQKCNSMIKIWPVFIKEKKFVRYTAQSENCSSVMGLFCFIAVFSHSQVYSLIKVRK